MNGALGENGNQSCIIIIGVNILVPNKYIGSKYIIVKSGRFFFQTQEKWETLNNNTIKYYCITNKIYNQKCL